MSEAIGPLNYAPGRAVQVRVYDDTNQQTGVQSAVHSDVAVYTNTRLETDAVLAAWPEIMQAAADKAVEILAAVPPVQPAPPPGETV